MVIVEVAVIGVLLLALAVLRPPRWVGAVVLALIILDMGRLYLGDAEIQTLADLIPGVGVTLQLHFALTLIIIFALPSRFEPYFATLNTTVLAIGRVLAVILLALMVCFILGQVFFRYVLNDAPNWTEEAARFGMLWMTGLIAPLAYRFGGFVAIDSLEGALGKMAAAALSTVLLVISFFVLVIAVDRGLNDHVFSFTGRGNSASLRLPLELFGGENIRFKNSWMFASLAVGSWLMLMVNVELLLRQIAKLRGREDELTQLESADMAGAD